MTGQKHKKKLGDLLDPKKDIFTRFQKFRTREIIILCNNAYISFYQQLHVHYYYLAGILQES